MSLSDMKRDSNRIGIHWRWVEYSNTYTHVSGLLLGYGYGVACNAPKDCNLGSISPDAVLMHLRYPIPESSGGIFAKRVGIQRKGRNNLLDAKKNISIR